MVEQKKEEQLFGCVMCKCAPCSCALLCVRSTLAPPLPCPQPQPTKPALHTQLITHPDLQPTHKDDLDSQSCSPSRRLPTRRGRTGRHSCWRCSRLCRPALCRHRLLRQRILLHSRNPDPRLPRQPWQPRCRRHEQHQGTASPLSRSFLDWRLPCTHLPAPSTR